MTITVNNRTWHIVYVSQNSQKLMSSNKVFVLGVTDNNDSTVYLNNKLRGRMLDKVLSHELCHVFCFSYGILVSMETEELIADFLATYGREVFDIADDVLGRFAENFSYPLGY